MTVREIDAPADLEALAALTPVDWRESFTLAVTGSRSAEQWARHMLEGASWKARAQMVTTWTLLGIPLAPPWSRSQVLGWRIRHNTPGAIVLEVRAAAGVTARLVLHISGTDLTQVMLVRYDHPPGRLIWSRLAPAHHRFLRALLEVGQRRARS
ncbi:hypothetical protein KOI35_38620 [Actinoplanes bogorensis]|uniref:DUF2867 domain-containing protein n=1 Tax=Paractinoplanes bogorensis TaxID=1610840 RepID=A0ABS5Z1A5_9ACTN|nr:hypothetical protein [Actinoplanes bogorensis]MBU2669443.1 hypothetical protein [Actinoplanes bogorensis]